MLGRMATSPPLPQDDPGVDVVHAPRDILGDLYHELLGAPWSLTLLVIAVMLLALNVGFALVYVVTGGIANAEHVIVRGRVLLQRADAGNHRVRGHVPAVEGGAPGGDGGIDRGAGRRRAGARSRLHEIFDARRQAGVL